MTTTDRSNATRPALAQTGRQARSAHRAERARRRALELELSRYTSQSDMLELEAIVDRAGEDDVEFRQIVQQLRSPASSSNASATSVFL